MPTYGEIEGKTWGEVNALLAEKGPPPTTLEERVAALEEKMAAMFPHAHCHPDDCPCPNSAEV